MSKKRYNYFQLWLYNELVDSLSYSDLRVYCKNNDLNMDNMLRTLPDYPSELPTTLKGSGFLPQVL